MSDIYPNYQALSEVEQKDTDYRIETRQQSNTNTVIIAPHGGGIEYGSSEITKGIAADNYSYALFEGLKGSGNSDLHITSTNFDEPDCLALVETSKTVVTIHGEGSDNKIAYLGGTNQPLLDAIKASLEHSGFKTDTHPKLKGESASNICNRGTDPKGGVQLELALGLRKTFFESLDRLGRTKPTPELQKFNDAVRQGIEDAAG
ncbi:MAG: poly-gamma-glutamate hydrolase family protein [Algicola sp.]|nr:poly-gamma-glutamate hydrolase family protein [Algicola sp.]